jgi:hypothetical protein
MHYVITIFVIACAGAVAFLLCFLTALCRDKKGALGCEERAKDRYSTSTRVKSHVVPLEPITGGRSVERQRKGWWAAVITICACSMSLRAQSTGAGDPAPTVENCGKPCKSASANSVATTQFVVISTTLSQEIDHARFGLRPSDDSILCGLDCLCSFL